MKLFLPKHLQMQVRTYTGTVYSCRPVSRPKDAGGILARRLTTDMAFTIWLYFITINLRQTYLPDPSQFHKQTIEFIVLIRET